VEAFVNSTVVFATPLLIAAIAGLIAERTGVLNVGLEGFMLGGAFLSAWVAGGDGSVIAGLLTALAAGLAIGALYGLVVVHLRADQVAVGIAFNIFVLGATSYGYALIISSDGQPAMQTGSIATLSVPLLGDLPWLGPVFDQPWLTYVGYALVPITFVLLFRTGLGVRARACGEHSAGAQAAGVDVARLRLVATAVSCMLAGLAGAYLVLADAHQFVNNMSAGKGYIALAVVILGRWNPIGAVAAAVLFGGAEALNFEVQSGSVLGLDLPVALVQTLPYVVTIVAVTLVGRRVRAPAEDGRPLAL
jgi:general nucleoside transport system permease protein